MTQAYITCSRATWAYQLDLRTADIEYSRRQEIYCRFIAARMLRNAGLDPARRPVQALLRGRVPRKKPRRLKGKYSQYFVYINYLAILTAIAYIRLSKRNFQI